jgi:hypothetical protein
MKRYVWDEYKRASEKDQKQTPKAKNDDFPTCLKYVANFDPTFGMLKGAPEESTNDWEHEKALMAKTT